MDLPPDAPVRSLRPPGGDPARSRTLLRTVLQPYAPSTLPGPRSSDRATGHPTPTRTPTPTPRRHWMDVLRGVAILLVLLTHVRAQGWRLHRIDERWLGVLVDTVAPVRIPLLVLLSGMLLARSLAKGPRPFVVGKLRGLAWPYVLWSLVYLATWRVLPDVDGGSHGSQGVADVLLEPVSVLWYLHLLLGLYLAALVLHQVPGVRPWHLLGLAAVGWLVAASGSSADWKRAACLAFFFLAGDVVARVADRGLPPVATRCWSSATVRRSATVALLVAASPLVVWAWWQQPARYAPYSLVPAAAAMLLLARAARATRGSLLERPLAWVGRQSLVFFVAHWLLVGLSFDAVALLVDPGVRPWPATGLVLLATVAGCSLLALAQQRVGAVGWLFAAPRGRAAPRDRVQG